MSSPNPIEFIDPELDALDKRLFAAYRALDEPRRMLALRLLDEMEAEGEEDAAAGIGQATGTVPYQYPQNRRFSCPN